MWSYKDFKIISAAPKAEIIKYLHELGAIETQETSYDYEGLKIEITAYHDDEYPDLGVPRHMITVHGDPIPAEVFLTKFRYRFLSAGG